MSKSYLCDLFVILGDSLVKSGHGLNIVFKVLDDMLPGSQSLLKLVCDSSLIIWNWVRCVSRQGGGDFLRHSACVCDYAVKTVGILVLLMLLGIVRSGIMLLLLLLCWVCLIGMLRMLLL